MDQSRHKPREKDLTPVIVARWFQCPSFHKHRNSLPLLEWQASRGTDLELIHDIFR